MRHGDTTDLHCIRMGQGSNNIVGPIILVILDSLFLSSLLVYSSIDFSSANNTSSEGLVVTEEECPAIAKEGRCSRLTVSIGIEKGNLPPMEPIVDLWSNIYM